MAVNYSSTAPDMKRKIHEDPFICFKIVAYEDGVEKMYKVKQTSKLGKVFAHYCERQRLSPDTPRFLYNGNRVSPTLTPLDLDMEDGDQIEAVKMQPMGGGGYGPST